MKQRYYTIIFIILTLLVNVGCKSSYPQPNPNFKYSDYETIDLDELIKKTQKSDFSKTQYNNDKPMGHLEIIEQDKGSPVPKVAIDILPQSKKYHIEATIEQFPSKLKIWPGKKKNVYAHILDGFTKQEIPVNYSIVVKSKNGKELAMLIQDILVPTMFDELKEGGKVSLYCLHYFNDNEGPGLLVSEFTKIPSKN